MCRPNISTRTLSAAGACAAIGVLAVPALAAAPVDPPRDAPPRLAAPTASTADAASRLARAARESGRTGPFVPVAGAVDYGTAANAFGAARSGHMHAGHDLFAPAGTPLVAVADGEVVDAGSDGGQGNYVHLYDPRRKATYVYMHMLAPARAKPGERVRAGEQLGALGCTGSCWGDHLHFEIRTGRGMTGEPEDPLPSLKRWEPLKKPVTN